MSAKTKKKAARKAPVPKPSTLLARALALFGPKGENWIKGELESEIGGFVDTAPFKGNAAKALAAARKDTELFLDENTAQELAYEAIQDAVYEEKTIEEIVAVATAQKKRFVETPTHMAYCSVGALDCINTPNESEAKEWLEKALDKLGHDSDIIQFNDTEDTTFPMVKKAFETAIKLAKAAGR